MKKIIICLTFSSLILQSCATILSGSKAHVRLHNADSTQLDAKVFLNGAYMGTVAESNSVKVSKNALKNGQTVISIRKEGYQDQNVQINRQTQTGFVILDLLFFWTIVEPVVDFATGSIYKPSPKTIGVNLEPKQK
jgi:hypothetical protein